MKKMLLAAATIAVIVSSCSKREVIDTPANPDNAVGFSSFIQKNTKGSTTDRKNFDQFAVLAYERLTPETQMAASSPTFMYNTPIVKNKLSGKWDYKNASDIKYWSSSADVRYNFYAYSPITTDQATNYKVSSAATTGYPTLDYTAIADRLKYTTDHHDIIVDAAEEISNVSKDGLVDGKVKLDFVHATTRVSVSLTVGGNYDTKIFVKSAKFKNVKSVGKFAFDKCVAGPYHPTNNDWWNESVVVDYETVDQTLTNGLLVPWDVVGDSAKIVAPLRMESDTVNFQNCMFMIPQPLAGVQLEVTYAMQKATDVSPIVQTAVLMDLDGSEAWVPGKSIKYNVRVELNKVTFDADVVDWDDTNVQAPINGTATVNFVGGASLKDEIAKANILPAALTSLTINAGAAFTSADFTFLSNLSALTSLTINTLEGTSVDNLANYTALSMGASKFPTKLAGLRLHNVKSIDANALSGMADLAVLELTSPDAVTGFAIPTSLGSGSLTKLTKLTVKNVSAIAAGAFSNMSKVKTVVIEGLPKAPFILDASFTNMSVLKSFSATNVKEIKANTFNGLASLTSVNITSNSLTITDNSYNGLTSLKTFEIQGLNVAPSQNKLQGLTALMELNVSKNIYTDFAATGASFSSLTALNELRIENATSIATSTIQNLSALKALYLNKSGAAMSSKTLTGFGTSGNITLYLGEKEYKTATQSALNSGIFDTWGGVRWASIKLWK